MNSSRVSLKIYDLSGRLVRILADELYSHGSHHVRWDRGDAVGRKTPAGVYFCEFRTDNQREVQRLVVLD